MAFENLIIIDIKKAFTSVNYIFLTEVLKTFSFREEFIEWIKTLLNNKEFYMINDGKTSRCFRLEGGARKRNPVPSKMYILILEIFFLYMKNN